MLSNRTDVNIGARLRALRQDSGISIRTLATRTDFSPSFISQVEKGQASPSIASLERLARALGVSLVEFFAVKEESPTIVTRADRAPELRSTWSRAQIQALGPGGGRARLEPLLVTLEPGGLSGKHPSNAASDTFAFIVEGEVTITVGESQHTLRRGDAITLTVDMPHRWENTGLLPAQILVVSARSPR